MQLSITCPAEDFNVESGSHAVTRLGELVGQHESLRVNVTTAFVESVRDAIAGHDPDYAAAYEQEREFGFAVAKTIPQVDGSIDLIVDAALFGIGAEPRDALRTFEHEALHILTQHRGESLSDLRSRRNQQRGTAAGTYSAIAGVACEEYRVERALWRMHPEPRKDSHLTGFRSAIERCEERIRSASIEYQRHLDVTTIARTVTETFHAMCTSTAYVAAELDAGAAPPGVAVEPDLDARMLGDVWWEAVAALQRLPPADEPASFERLEQLSRSVGTRLEEWLEHIGFSLSDSCDGLHFGVLNPEEWVSWTDLL